MTRFLILISAVICTTCASAYSMVGRRDVPYAVRRLNEFDIYPTHHVGFGKDPRYYRNTMNKNAMPRRLTSYPPYDVIGLYDTLSNMWIPPAVVWDDDVHIHLPPPFPNFLINFLP
eukprot:GHVR01067227.1.p1 GENE.GHVR01067227.1~~GHVR01067227.1.p1  ORF type:complete len:124 (+),score=9.96 GHVR01067227.1:26-373(+)